MTRQSNGCSTPAPRLSAAKRRITRTGLNDEERREKIKVFYQLYKFTFCMLACTHRHNIGGDKGIVRKYKILRRHEAHIRFLLLHRNNTDETDTTKQCTNGW